MTIISQKFQSGSSLKVKLKPLSNLYSCPFLILVKLKSGLVTGKNGHPLLPITDELFVRLAMF